MKTNGEFKVGAKVIISWFKDDEFCTCTVEMDDFLEQEGIITEIGRKGYRIVHGYAWPISALTALNNQ